MFFWVTVVIMEININHENHANKVSNLYTSFATPHGEPGVIALEEEPLSARANLHPCAEQSPSAALS
jgi:hypothetical protein